MTISLRKALLLTVATTGLLSVSGFASESDILAEQSPAKVIRSASALPTASASNGVSGPTQNGVQKPKKSWVQRLFPCCTKKNLEEAEEFLEGAAAVAVEVLKVVGTATGNNDLIEAGNITAAGGRALHSLAQDLSTNGIHASNVLKDIDNATATVTAVVGGNTAEMVGTVVHTSTNGLQTIAADITSKPTVIGLMNAVTDGSNLATEITGQVAPGALGAVSNVTGIISATATEVSDLASVRKVNVTNMMKAGADIANKVAAHTHGSTSKDATITAAVLTGLAEIEQAKASVSRTVSAANSIETLV